MTSEKDKRRITEEEVFRLEVRKSLAQEKPPKDTDSALWTFLNSSFGLWILSTLVIGCFGWVYAQWQASRENSALIDRLDIEIEARLQAAEWSYPFYRVQKNAAPFYQANGLILPPSEQGIIHPEFANRNTKSLLYELLRRVPRRDKTDVQQAIDQVRLIETEFLNQELTSEQADNFLDKVQKLRNIRWVPVNYIERLDRSAWYEKPLEYLSLAIVSPWLLWVVWVVSLVQMALAKSEDSVQVSVG